MPITKAASESKLSSLQSDVNMNVAWMSGKWVGLTYLLLIVAARLLLFYSCTPMLTPEWQWTLLSIAHGVTTFIAFHWNRGSPDWSDQGEHIDQTVWEQIDNGVPWTETRKYLMVVPIILFLVVSHYTDYAAKHLLINAGVLAVLMVSKLPEMHGVRIFRINKAPID